MVYNIAVFEKGGQEKVWNFDKEEISIGRVQGNDIILPKGNVSKRHARIVFKDGKFILVDLRSTNGTYVNGRKIASPIVVTPSDKIYVGDFILSVSEPAAGAQPEVQFEEPPEMAPPPPPMGAMEPPPAPVPQPVAAPEPKPSFVAPPPIDVADSVTPVPRPQPVETAPPELVELMEPEPDPEPILEPELEAEPEVSAEEASALTPPGGMVIDPEATAALSADMAAKIDAMSAPAPVPVPEPAPIPEPVEETLQPDEPMLEDGPLSDGTVALDAVEEPDEQLDEPTPAPPVPAPEMLTDLEEDPDIIGEPSIVDEQQFEEQELPPESPPPAPAPAGLLNTEEKDTYIALLGRAVADVSAQVDLSNTALTDDDLWNQAENACYDKVEAMANDGEVPEFLDPNQLIQDVLNEILGYGPLEPFLADQSVSEIHVNRFSQLFVNREGSVEETRRAFSSNAAYISTINKMLSAVGAGPLAELPALATVRLLDGATIELVRESLAPQGPVLTYRKPGSLQRTIDDLVGVEFLSDKMAEFLKLAASARRTILFVGRSGTGRTTLLNSLLRSQPGNERLVLIEKVAQLELTNPNVVSLQLGGGEALNGPDVIRHASKLLPDRLVVGDLDGSMASEFVQAIHNGLSGALACAVGSNPEDCLARIERSIRLRHPEYDSEAVREHVSSAIDIVVHAVQYPCGTRKVTHVASVTGVQNDRYAVKDVFHFKPYGQDEDGTIKGRLLASGYVPEFVREMKQSGVEVDMGLFK